MAENSDGQEKTEAPTAKKLEKAREDGQIARSRELTTFLMTFSAAVFLYIFGAGFAEDLRDILVAGLTFEREHAYDLKKLYDHILSLVIAAFWLIAPFLLLMTIIAIVGSSLLGGFNFTTKPWTPDLKKLNPITGVKRMVSLRSLVELLKTVGKFVLVMSVAILFLWSVFDELVLLASEPLQSGLAHAAKIIVEAFLYVSLALIVIVSIDVPYQLWQHNNEMKMTKQEVKEEHKQQEGDPQIKARIRQKQREMAAQRMMQRVPEADVVVTNPTHYAVALKYDQATMQAPIVLASGLNFMAAEIRTIAQEHDIPMVEAPELARALYYNCELEQPIPDSLFTAVAAVLAYVFGLRENRKVSLNPDSLKIPEGMKTEP